MKIFVSSLISGMEPLRKVVRDAITTVGSEAVMAEDFGARPETPQIACLSGLRQADIVVLILGEHYGAVQPSGRSATHEEYEEAKGRKTILTFVQEGVQREAAQEEFAREVQAWQTGLFRSGFRTPEELGRAVTRALFDLAVTAATGPVDKAEMTGRARALLPVERRGYANAGASINLAISGGPRQTILRPIEIEKAALAEVLVQRALFNEPRLFDLQQGVRHGIEQTDLVITQDRGATVRLTPEGSVSVTLPVRRVGQMGLELIEEVVQEQLSSALAFASNVLEHIDATQRLTHVAIAASITGGEYMAWRTQREHDGSSNGMSLGQGQGERIPVEVTQSRAALRMEAAHIVEDLIVPLRRQRR